jgi:hypothetical protein
MKTAVEWFYDEIKHIIPNDYLKKYEQAKDLEMKNLAQAFEDGEHNYFYSKKTGKDFENGIEYYNEKFKKDEQMNEHDELFVTFKQQEQ